MYPDSVTLNDDVDWTESVALSDWGLDVVCMSLLISCEYTTVHICLTEFTVSCNINSSLIPWSSDSSKISLDMKALMWLKQLSKSSGSSSDWSLPGTGPTILATWNSSSADNVIKYFLMSHTSCTVRHDDTSHSPFRHSQIPKMKSVVLSPLSHILQLDVSVDLPITSTTAQVPPCLWSHGSEISGSASLHCMKLIPDEPPQICCRPHPGSPLNRWELSFCNEEREQCCQIGNVKLSYKKLKMIVFGRKWSYRI